MGPPFRGAEVLRAVAAGLVDLDRRLRTLRDGLVALGVPIARPGTSPLLTLTTEDAHQEAIWAALTAAGVPAVREFPLTAWDGRRSARVDFLLLGEPGRARVESSVPVQYKPPWAGTDAVVDDLFLLLRWWRGRAGGAPDRRLWHLVEGGPDPEVPGRFAWRIDEARKAVDRGSRDPWDRALAEQAPTLEVVAQAPVGDTRLCLVDYALAPRPGAPPVAGVDAEWEPGDLTADG